VKFLLELKNHSICTLAFCFFTTLSLTMNVLAQPRDSGMDQAENWKAVQALTAWFECEECEEGELRAVLRYGQSVVPSLIAALNHGPSPASRELQRLGIERRYEELVRQAEQKPERKLASTKEEFVSRYMSNFDAQYRVRAAQALAAIGGRDARSALEKALPQAPRADVRTTIQQSLEKMKR
jgi:hypothetical protein